jgi:outer membrane protein OmpA-like peptidoglycan-associated protein
MASKKQSFLIAFLCLMGAAGMAQVRVGTGSYNLYDSSIYPTKRMPQHSEFLANNYAYPAKPRNMIELGIAAGMFTVSGDVPAVVPTPGFTAHIRKALGYIFSLRLQYMYGIGKGLHWLEAHNYQKNPAWFRSDAQRYDANVLYNGPAVGGSGNFDRYMHVGADKVFYNYKTTVNDLSLQGVITLNNVRFHKQKSGMVIYGMAGVGASVYKTFVNALGANGQKYNFNGIGSATHEGRKETLKALKDLMDKSYETPAERHNARRPKLGEGTTLKPSGTIGAGIAFKLGKRINLAIEDRHTFIKDDLLDGQRWQEHAAGDAVMTRDFDSYNMLSVGLNFNLGAKSVEPLWWLNPLDYAYGDLPARTLNRFKYVPKDGDGDGVMDEMDKEPNTPAGCPVNTHGITADTDGDGVPDCKDKELITPTQCQPVDADGIGKCPEPKCCDEIKKCCENKPVVSCNFTAPAVEFRAGSCTLSADAKAALDNLAADMRANPTCNVNVTARGESKAMQKLANCRAEAIQKYLVGKGISEGRVSVNVDQTQDSNTADIEVTGGM